MIASASGKVSLGRVPNRFEHGYGLSPEIVELAIQEKQPDLIITVDNGIPIVQS
jgi:single-stranded DNA-specific DHH superfamily exonuclease